MRARLTLIVITLASVLAALFGAELGGIYTELGGI